MGFPSQGAVKCPTPLSLARLTQARPASHSTPVGNGNSDRQPGWAECALSSPPWVICLTHRAIMGEHGRAQLPESQQLTILRLDGFRRALIRLLTGRSTHGLQPFVYSKTHS